MITIVTRWETTQLPPINEWQLWRQMKDAFGISRFVFVPVVDNDFYGMDKNLFQQYPTMTEALAAQIDRGELVFLESSGEQTVDEIPQGDIVMVLGNTSMDNLAHSNPEQRYRIEGGGRYNDLYGINAAAIALAMRYKSGAHR